MPAFPTKQIEWLVRFDDLTNVGSIDGVPANATMEMVDLDSAGQEWLGGQTQGIKIGADFVSGITSSIFFQTTQAKVNGFVPGANERFAYVCEWTGADDDNGYPHFAPRFTFLNPGFGDQVYHPSCANRRKKDKLMFFPFQANVANMTTPNNRSNVITVGGNAPDYDNPPTGGFLTYMIPTGDQPTATMNAFTLIGIVKLIDPKPIFSLTFDDNSRDVLTVWLPELIAHDIPFGMYIQTERLEGQAGYDPSLYLSNADFDQLMALKLADGVTNMFTPMYHGHGHNSIAGYNDVLLEGLSFVQPDTINFPASRGAIFDVGDTLVIKGPERVPGEGPSVNDGLRLTVGSINGNGASITTVENTITNEDARTEGVPIWIDRDDAERRAQIETGLPLMQPFWDARPGLHKMFAHPFGRQCNASIAILKEHGFTINRGTDDIDNGSYYQNFINHNGSINEPMNLKLLFDLGRNVNTTAEVSQRLDMLEYVGGHGEGYGHTSTNGVATTDYVASEVAPTVANIGARKIAGTIEVLGKDVIAEAEFGPAPGGSGVNNPPLSSVASSRRNRARRTGGR